MRATRTHLLPIGLAGVVIGLGWLVAAPALAQQGEDAQGFEQTPPRLAFTDGDVSFWRPGATDWAPAQINTPLAAGDELYSSEKANLEIQIGARSYVRAGENTQLGLTSVEPDYLQLRVTGGSVSLDLRSLAASQTIELDTPNAAFTVERSGYYRIGVDGETTSFTTRRGGRAVVTPASGASAAIEPSEMVVVTGTDSPTVETYAAPELDAWDRWNYARTDDLIDAVSARYVPRGVYGAADLDRYGDWRVVPTYGAVWMPRGLPAGWAPYSTGRWIYDPFYGWTWVDDAPWGWAPFHYGRWVQVSGFWGWCPGPVVARPYYAPALVAFFGGGGVSVGITIGTPYVGWVALGWGEPLLPWWGPVGFRGVPHWAHWGGPRIVNRVVVRHTTVIRARDIHGYANAHDRRWIVTERRDRFGRRFAKPGHFTRGDVARFEPLHGHLDVKPHRSSLVPALGHTRRPPKKFFERRVVATRAPRAGKLPAFQKERGARAAAPHGPPPVHVVTPERKGRRIVAPGRPPFGQRGSHERATPPPVPRYGERHPANGPSGRAAPSGTRGRGRETRSAPGARPAPPTRPPREERSTRQAPGRRQTRPSPQAPPSGRQTRPSPQASPGRRQTRPSPQAPPLPGEPANRIWRDHSRGRSRNAPHGESSRAAPSPPQGRRSSTPPSPPQGRRSSTPPSPPQAGHGSSPSHAGRASGPSRSTSHRKHSSGASDSAPGGGSSESRSDRGSWGHGRGRR